MRLETAFWPACLLTAGVIALGGCDKDKPPTPEKIAKPSASATASAEPSASDAPTGCKASGTEPMKLGTSVGMVYGLVGDATALYFVTWDAYGSRGTLTKSRKDGGGTVTLTSMELEPRGLAIDDDTLFFTSGIRLMRFLKKGEAASVVAPIFASQQIALAKDHVFGVPADYGPYDRVAVVPKRGGEVDEIATEKRPTSKEGPNGFTSIAFDGSSIYVADAGHDHIGVFPVKDGKVDKEKTLVAHQPKVETLVLDGERVVYTLGLKGELWSTPKSGGKAEKLASGLAPHAALAVDKQGIYTTFAGKDADAPHTLGRLAPEGGAPTAIASADATCSVESIALDADCVYWIEREPRKSTLSLYARHR